MMFQRNSVYILLATLFITLISEAGLLFAQTVEPLSTASKLNRDSFVLCREIRTKFSGIQGQRVLFSKAYEIHEMADNLQRMVVLNAPVNGVDRALSDLSLLVDDFESTIKFMRLPVFRDPVRIQTGPNGYIFYGGNGYPQPCFQCNRFPYRMIPEQNVREVCQMLTNMKTSIVQLQMVYSPALLQSPKQKLFPAPANVPRSNSDWGKQNQPLRRPEKLFKENDSRWKPSRKTAPVFPPSLKAKPESLPSGPQFVPPLPSTK